MIYTLTLNGKSVGYIVLKKEDNNYLLQTIFVRKEERRKGYGTMLFKHAEKIANEENLHLLINVQPSNTACTELLKKNGYANIEYIQINSNVFRKLSSSDIAHILQVCDEKLDMYYKRITK